MSTGEKPTLIKAFDPSLQLCGKPVRVDCYVMAASNYDLLVAQVKHAIQCNEIGKNQQCTGLLKEILKQRGETL